MVEHLLIGDIAALLLVLGLTGPLLQPVLAIRVLRPLRFLAHPLVALPLWAVNLFFWHIPALYDGAYGTAPLHALEHAMFIFFGCLMWMPLVGPLPMPSWFGRRRLGYVIGGPLHRRRPRQRPDVVGHRVLRRYAAGEALLGHLAADRPERRRRRDDDRGRPSSTLGVFAWLFFRAAREGIERQRLLDLAEARASRSTRRARRARSPPARASGWRSGCSRRCGEPGSG